MKTKKADRQKWVALAMMLAKIWHLHFSVYPFSDFWKSNMWCAKFDSTPAHSSVFPLIGTRAGESVESATRKLVEEYIELYGEKMYPTIIRSIEELELKLAATGY